MLTRRDMIGAAIAAGVPGVGRAAAGTVSLPFGNGDRPLARYPQKRPLLRLTTRPPQLETPFEVFREGLLTPNDAFFVRYHLAGLPLDVAAATHELRVTGHVATPLTLSLAELKRDPSAVEIVAVNQCSGNSRGFSTPRVAGGQLGNGAMGNARWRGVPLRTVLQKAGVKPGAREVSFAGLDRPSLPTIPAYVKSLPIDHALEGDVLLAWAMNGADLPFLNGYPLRLVVPGYFGTYWMKHLSEIRVLDAPFDGYWMKSAYRIPDNDCTCVPPGTKPEATRPIGRLNVRSFVTSHEDEGQVPAGATLLRGIAFDGGSGIAEVAVSINGGEWRQADLGDDLGRYSFRGWQLRTTLSRGEHKIAVRATARSGERQPAEARWQPAGYMRNVIETIMVRSL